MRIGGIPDKAFPRRIRESARIYTRAEIREIGGSAAELWGDLPHVPAVVRHERCAGSASFDKVAANLVDRILVVSDPDQVRELGLSLAAIEDDCDDQTRSELLARLIRRSGEEPNPGLLRAIAEVAGSLSPNSSAPDVFARVFTMPDAPCQIFLDRHDTSSLVQRILNRCARNPAGFKPWRRSMALE